MNEHKNAGVLKGLFLVSGILNLVTTIVWLLLTMVATVTIAILGCGGVLLALISAAACITDFICYNRLNKMNRTGTFKTIKIAAVLDICVIFTLNITSVIFGFIILNMLSKPETKQELTEKGIY